MPSWETIESDKGKYLDLGRLPTHVKLGNPDKLTDIEVTILVAVLQTGGDVPVFTFRSQSKTLDTKPASLAPDSLHVMSVQPPNSFSVDDFDIDCQVRDAKVLLADTYAHTDVILLDDDSDNNDNSNTRANTTVATPNITDSHTESLSVDDVNCSVSTAVNVQPPPTPPHDHVSTGTSLTK